MTAKPGRPSTLTPEIEVIIIDKLKKGNYRDASARAAGVSPRTLSSWLTLGRRGIPPYDRFLRVVQEAEAEAETVAVEGVRGRGDLDPKHYQWWLARKFPEKWGDCRKEIVKLLKELREIMGGGKSARIAVDDDSIAEDQPLPSQDGPDAVS